MVNLTSVVLLYAQLPDITDMYVPLYSASSSFSILLFGKYKAGLTRIDDNCTPSDSSQIDQLFTSPPCKSEICACGASFADLGEEAIRRLTLSDQDEPIAMPSFKDSPPPPGRNYSGP